MTAAALEALGEEIATFAARVDVATHAMLSRLRTFDAHEGWGRMGATSCAHWLSYRAGVGLAAAREKVRVARALGELGRVDAAFGQGVLSYSKVRAITRVATPATEQSFIDIALYSTAAQLERLCGAYHRTRNDPEEAGADLRRFVRRRTTRSGMEVIEIQLPPEQANIVWQAMQSAMDQQPGPGTAAGAGEGADDAALAAHPGPISWDRGPACRGPLDSAEECGGSGLVVRGEEDSAEECGGAGLVVRGEEDSAEECGGSGLVVRGEDASAEACGDAGLGTGVRREDDAAEACGGTGFGGGIGEDDSEETSGRGLRVLREVEWEPPLAANDPAEQAERRADAIVDVARGYLRMRPRTLGAAYELVVVTTPEHLRDGPAGVGGFLRDGTPLPLHVVRGMASDGSRVEVSVGERGGLLDVGRRTRTIPPAIARALWLRDGGCRFPSCQQRNHLRAHHIVFWMDGGPTSLDNLVLLCGRHHRRVHEGKASVGIRDGGIEFTDERGRRMPAVPASAATGADLDELDLFLRDADFHLDPGVNMPRWDGTPLDVDEVLSWMEVAEHPRRVGHPTPQVGIEVR